MIIKNKRYFYSISAQVFLVVNSFKNILLNTGDIALVLDPMGKVKRRNNNKLFSLKQVKKEEGRLMMRAGLGDPFGLQCCVRNGGGREASPGTKASRSGGGEVIQMVRMLSQTARVLMGKLTK